MNKRKQQAIEDNCRGQKKKKRGRGGGTERVKETETQLNRKSRGQYIRKQSGQEKKIKWMNIIKGQGQQNGNSRNQRKKTSGVKHYEGQIRENSSVHKEK